MSTPNTIKLRVGIRRIPGITTRAHIAHVHAAIAKYKAGMWPGDPFMDYEMKDVEVYPHRPPQCLGYVLICSQDPAYPKIFKTAEEALAFKEMQVSEWPIYMKPVRTMPAS